MSKYYELKNNEYEVRGSKNECSHLKIRIYYDKGGISYADYKQKPRGYYISITPVVVRENGFESFTAFSGGGYMLIEETKRKSEKRLEQIAKEYYDNEKWIDIYKMSDLYQKLEFIDEELNKKANNAKEKEVA